MLQTRPRTQPRRLLHDMETLVADTALVFSLLPGAGGCLSEPDEEDDFTEEEDWNEETRSSPRHLTRMIHSHRCFAGDVSIPLIIISA